MKLVPRLVSLVSPHVGPHLYRALGMNIFGYRAWLDETLKWSPAERQAFRLRRLNQILDFCWNHNRFYQQFWRDHGLRPAPLGALEEIAAYPILEKNEFRRNIAAIRSVGIEKIPHKTIQTGGSTGEPLKFCQDLEHHSMRTAYWFWGREQAGYRYGDPCANVSGGRMLPDMHKKISMNRLRFFIENTIPLLGVSMNRDLAREYHQILVENGVKFLGGYPSILSIFCSFLAEEKLTIPTLKAVFTTAEVLQPAYRTNIERALGCPVWDEYGCNDGGLLSFECHRHDGYHYNDLEAVVECVEPDADGIGKVVVTNIWNRSTPFIRYQNEDMVALQAAPCPCGLPYPMIRTVAGRTMDILKFEDGRMLCGQSITRTFAMLPNIDEIQGFQAVQRSPRDLEMRVMTPAGLSDENRRFIEKIFAHHLGEHNRLRIVNVDQLEMTASGKLKPVWVDFDRE